MLTAEQTPVRDQPTHRKPVANKDLEHLLVIQKIRETAQGMEKRIQSALRDLKPLTQ